jgi:uncharacterized protein
MPKASELPEQLNPLVRRHAINLRHDHFGRDAQALIEKIREAFGDKPVGVNRWRAAAGAIAALLLLAWIGLFVTGMPLSVPWSAQPDTREQAEKDRLAAAKAEEERRAKAATEAEARARAEQAEKERLAAAKAEEERRAKAATEAEARATAEQAEKERLAAAKAEQERHNQAELEAREAPPATATRPKITDRIEPGSPQTASTPPPGTQAGVSAAQKVVLYEEHPADPNGKRFVGSAIWRTETITPGPGQPPELAIRADVEVPERKLAMTWSLRRNTDKGLPATHTFEIMFKVPADFPSGGISNVPGILMKQAEQTRGVPLAGLAVKVTPGFYLIGLSNVEADKDRNIQLLKERSWFDIPVVYNNNRRAILALEKGTPGERVFADAFKVWRQEEAVQAAKAQADAEARRSGAPQDDMGRFVSRVLGSTELQWKQIFAQDGRIYRAPVLVVYRGVTHDCGGVAQSATGPFYCPMDQKVYLDTSFLDQIAARFRACDVDDKCQFARAYVIAHEIGHHVQNLLGILPKAQQAQRSAGSSAMANHIQVQVELQADCLAGVWANHQNEYLGSQDKPALIEAGDLETALRTAAAIGDDTLQRKAQDYVVPDPLTHGSAEQRQRWFNAGLKSGSVASCNTFAAAQL